MMTYKLLTILSLWIGGTGMLEGARRWTQLHVQEEIRPVRKVPTNVLSLPDSLSRRWHEGDIGTPSLKTCCVFLYIDFHYSSRTCGVK